MKAWNVSAECVEHVVRAVSVELYDGNLCFKRPPEQYGKAVRFTLTVRKASLPGGRRSNTGRKIWAACWHCHRDVMKALFAIRPDMRLKTAQADYRGLDDFEDSFESTSYINIGSVAAPLYYEHACECND